MTSVPSELRSLFWDIDLSTFDAGKYPRYVIERVLEIGDERGVRWLRSHSLTGIITSVIRDSRRLSRRSANFWALVFNVPRDEVRALRGPTAAGIVMADPGSSWYPEVLPQGWVQSAALIHETGATNGFYLAGGTGLALQLGHRVSVDLDLFTHGRAAQKVDQTPLGK